MNKYVLDFVRSSGLTYEKFMEIPAVKARNWNLSVHFVNGTEDLDWLESKRGIIERQLDDMNLSHIRLYVKRK